MNIVKFSVKLYLKYLSPRSSTESSSHDLSHLGDVPTRQLLRGEDEQDAERAEAVQEQPQQHRQEVLPEATHQVSEWIDFHDLRCHEEEHTERRQPEKERRNIMQ